MSTLEDSMQSFFKNERENKIKIDSQKEVDIREPITVSVIEDLPKPKSVLKLPFAWVASVAENSPADEAGLKVGDGIVAFDNSLYYGLTNNPLQKIAEIVGKKIGKEIPVEVIRRRTVRHNEILEEEINEYISLSLTPHQWAGQGVLGCKLNLTEK